MAGCLDTEKLAEWRERLDRFTRSGLTVARFCARDRVSESAFYRWREKLGQAVLRRRIPARPGAFRQVAVLSAPPAVAWRAAEVSPAVDTGVSAAPGVSIHLPRGTRIDVPATHLDAVRAVIAEVARADRSPQAEAGPSSWSPTPDEEGGVVSC